MTHTTLSLSELQQFDHNAPDASGDERRFCCPLCGQQKAIDTTHRSLTANVKTGAWHCHRCDERGKLQEYWTEQMAEGQKQNRRDRGRTRLAQKMKLADPVILPPPDPDKDRAWRTQARTSVFLDGSPGADYLTLRYIPLDLAKAAHVRYCANWFGHPAVLFPAYDLAGELIAAQGRHIDGYTQPKARTQGQVKLGVFATRGAWGADEIVICEGPIDALTLAAAGRPALALFGKDVRPWIVKKCVLERVCLAFDGDQAGDQAAAKWTAELETYGATVIRLRPPAGEKDFNELAMQFDTLENGIAAVRQAITLECPKIAPHAPESLGSQKAAQSVPKNEAAAQLLREVYELLDRAANATYLTAAIEAFTRACDLPTGYTDPDDPFTDMAFSALADELRRLSRMTPDIARLLRVNP
jgi:hypothetical protein